ncbi:hypothetical protein, partial [uncultured Muribaculum sp.]|uniref:hypothetical protein n=1 Tax=uncultured Muribaculum sp. TaxID=1918613 RepID=UPI00272CFAA9
KFLDSLMKPEKRKEKVVSNELEKVHKKIEMNSEKYHKDKNSNRNQPINKDDKVQHRQHRPVQPQMQQPQKPKQNVQQQPQKTRQCSQQQKQEQPIKLCQ